MNWICIGLIAGSLITSLHDTEESCRGREAMLQKSKGNVVATKCVEMPHVFAYGGGGSSNNFILTPGTTTITPQ